jgi:hypothetical protein
MWGRIKSEPGFGKGHDQEFYQALRTMWILFIYLFIYSYRGHQSINMAK